MKISIKLFLRIVFGVVLAYWANAVYEDQNTSWLVFIEHKMSVDWAVYVQDFFAGPEMFLARVAVVGLAAFAIGYAIGGFWKVCLGVIFAFLVFKFFRHQDVESVRAQWISGLILIVVWFFALIKIFSDQNPHRYAEGTRKEFLDLGKCAGVIIGGALLYMLCSFLGVRDYVSLPILGLVLYFILWKGWLRAG